MKPNLSFRPIRTRRLLIRHLEARDYEAWKKSHSSRAPSRNEFDRGPLPAKRLTRAAFRKRLDRERWMRVRDLQYNLQIFDRRSGELLGSIDFLILTRLSLQWANLGYAIHNRHWGKGIATEAVRAVLPAAFRRLKLHRIEASTAATHRASVAVMRKCGLKYEGKRRAYLYERGAWQGFVVYSAVAGEWGLAGSRPRVRTEIGD